MNDSKIFDLIANLIASIEKNNDIIHNYKSSRNSDFEKKANAIVIKAVEDENFTKLEKYISKLKDDDDSNLEEKLYILLAIDSLYFGTILGAKTIYGNMFKNTQTSSYLNSKENALLTGVKVYFTFPNVMNRNRENIDKLGMH